jgi:hypothetical protein
MRKKHQKSVVEVIYLNNFLDMTEFAEFARLARWSEPEVVRYNIEADNGGVKETANYSY